METCGGARHWGRLLRGHEVKLIPAKWRKPLHAAAEKAAGRITKAMGFKAASTMNRGDGYGSVGPS